MLVIEKTGSLDESFSISRVVIYDDGE